jgi:hypothetical protein
MRFHEMIVGFLLISTPFVAAKREDVTGAEFSNGIASANVNGTDPYNGTDPVATLVDVSVSVLQPGFQ